MAMNVGEKQTISVCKRERNSTWGNDTARRTSVGMKMQVEIQKNSRGEKVSVTSYVSA